MGILLCLILGIVFVTLVAINVLTMPCLSPVAWNRQHNCRGTNTGHPWARAGPAPPGPVPMPVQSDEICISIVADDYLPDDVRELTVQNKARFARHWGHPFVAPPADVVLSMAAGRSSPWAKFPVIRLAFQRCRFVFMIDADAVILRSDIDLRVPAAEMDTLGKDILISADFNGLNSGVFMMRQSARSMDFLAEAEASAALLGDIEARIPLKYENRAFFYLTGAWPACGAVARPDAWLAPRYTQPRFNTTYFADALLVVDRCLLNQHFAHSSGHFLGDIMDPSLSYDSFENAFVVHAAGGKLPFKTRFLQTMLGTGGA